MKETGLNKEFLTFREFFSYCMFENAHNGIFNVFCNTVKLDFYTILFATYQKCFET